MINLAFLRPRGLFLLLILATLIVVYLFIDSGVASSYHDTVKLPSNTNSGVDNSKPEITQGPRTLLVSAFFPLSKSKHSMGDYKKWLTRFLGSITTDVYFYAPPEMSDLILHARGDLPITLNTTFSSPFDIPPLRGLQTEYETGQLEKDRERKIHSAHLYAVWNAKPYFLDEALKNQFGRVQYDYAFWNDGGSFRSTHEYRHWPDPERVQDIFGEHPETIFIPINWPPNPSMRYWKEDMGPIDNEFSEGSFFGGSPSAISFYQQAFYAYHNAFKRVGQFVGKDQTLINAILLLFPERFTTVWARDPNTPSVAESECGDMWFYYQFLLASDAERARMRESWDKKWIWPWQSRKGTCGVARVDEMTQLLKARFGSDWQHPDRTIIR